MRFQTLALLLVCLSSGATLRAEALPRNAYLVLHYENPRLSAVHGFYRIHLSRDFKVRLESSYLFCAIKDVSFRYLGFRLAKQREDGTGVRYNVQLSTGLDNAREDPFIATQSARQFRELSLNFTAFGRSMDFMSASLWKHNVELADMNDVQFVSNQEFENLGYNLWMCTFYPN